MDDRKLESVIESIVSSSIFFVAKMVKICCIYICDDTYISLNSILTGKINTKICMHIEMTTRYSTVLIRIISQP